jgi:hypothetical protein
MNQQACDLRSGSTYTGVSFDTLAPEGALMLLFKMGLSHQMDHQSQALTAAASRPDSLLVVDWLGAVVRAVAGGGALVLVVVLVVALLACRQA